MLAAQRQRIQQEQQASLQTNLQAQGFGFSPLDAEIQKIKQLEQAHRATLARTNQKRTRPQTAESALLADPSALWDVISTTDGAQGPSVIRGP